MKTDELREKYLAFFETKGCRRRPSDVLVPRWDPSVLFTPAGMNQFKDHFLGKVKLEFTRATTCQKCLRTGDIDNVGRTAYHHTFFEMLGNFSFGDYFKREAIHWAWEFLTDQQVARHPGRPAHRLGLSRRRRGVRHLEQGDQAAARPHPAVRRETTTSGRPTPPAKGPTASAARAAKSSTIRRPAARSRSGTSCSRSSTASATPPNNLRPLPSKNIDTGMGLERTASMLQGVDTNFHIDILRPIVEAAGEVCGMKYDPASENGRRLRRITDHVRACTFAIHEERLSRQRKAEVRRSAGCCGGRCSMAIRWASTSRSCTSSSPVVAEMMKQPYPELAETVERVAQRDRNRRGATFFRTIDAGLDRIERLFDDMRKSGHAMVSGREAAELYTTHGFPPELFETLAAEHNLTFDWAGFQRRDGGARQEVSGAGARKELFKSGPLDPLKKVMRGTEFLGYETIEAEGKIVGILAHDHLVETISEDGHEQPVTVVLDRTPFYGESGGQVGDTGELVGPGVRFEVIDTQKEDGFILHVGHLRRGHLQLGATVTARVDAARRTGIRRAHSATHILHYALQKHLGGHAQQQGSKVDDDWLRFDFANPSSVAAETLAADRDRGERARDARPSRSAGRTCRSPRPARPAR